MRRHHYLYGRTRWLVRPDVLEHLRRIRLDRARRSLLVADPASVSVADVAARWGFFHLGRFAEAYRALYQEPPSRTLAR